MPLHACCRGTSRNSLGSENVRTADIAVRGGSVIWDYTNRMPNAKAGQLLEKDIAREPFRLRPVFFRRTGRCN